MKAGQIRLALAGPSGSGKSTLARILLTKNQNAVCVWEPTPPIDVQLPAVLTPDLAEGFQREITATRHAQADAHPDAELLIFDRTFEEDREVFLSLYERLGYLTRRQVVQLRQVSLDAEHSIGPLTAGILLTGAPDVLAARVRLDPQDRPRWLLDHLHLEYELYARWLVSASGRFTVLDTSTLSLEQVGAAAQEQILKLRANA